MIKRYLPLLLVAGILYFSFAGTGQHMDKTTVMIKDTSQLHKQWERADSLEKLGHLEDLAEVLDSIYEYAHNNSILDHEVLSAYKLAILTEKTEHGVGWEKLIPTYEQRVEESTGVVNSLNKLTLAQLYLEYGNHYVWRTVRSDIERETEGTYKDWSLGELQSKAFHLFRTALEEPELKDVELTEIPRIVSSLKNIKFTPTLYDAIAQTFISNYTSSFNSISSVSSNPLFESPHLFAERSKFYKIEIPRDTSDYDAYILNFTQNYLKELEVRGATEALVKTDLDRLNLVNNSSQIDGKRTLYFNALERMVNEGFAGDARKYIVNAFLEKYEGEYSLSEYAGNDKKIDSLFLKHREVYDGFAEEYAGASLGIFAKAKKAQEAYATLSPTTEASYGAHDGILIYLDYKNIKNVGVQIIKLQNTVTNHEEYNRMYGNPSIERFAQKGTEIYKKKLDLPLTPSYRSHSAELSLPGLDYGLYLMKLTAESVYGDNKKEEYALFQVSDLHAFLLDSERLQVLQRKDGRNIENASVKIHGDKGVRQVQGTDKQGFTEIKEKSNYTRVRAEINYGEDVYITENFSVHRYQNTYTVRPFLKTFTDRSLYRPGQMIYFKSVLAQGEGSTTQVLPGRQVTFDLYNVNNEKVSSVDLTTDDYGAVTGSFPIPSSGLPGLYTIRADEFSSRQNIRVEEYKRPKFEVELEKPETKLTLGDKTTIEGVAMAYAGYPIASANVKLTVMRKEYRIPFYYYFYPPQSNAGKRILDVIIETDDEGKFSQEIEFEASSLEIKQNRTFLYEINVVVTDQAGESHNADMSLYVGTNPLLVSLSNLKERYMSDEDVTFTIKAENSARRGVATNGEVVLKELVPPEDVKFNRYWQMPDTVLMSEEEFNKIYPYLEYKENRGALDWKEKRTISTQKVDLTSTGKDLNYDLTEGVYKLEVKLKDASEKTFIITVLDKDNPFLYNDDIRIFIDKDIYQSGEEIVYKIARPENQLVYTLIQDKDAKVLDERMLDAGDSELRFTLPKREENLRIIAYTLQEGRVKQTSRQVRVLNKEHQYTIEIVKVDDIVKPGDKLTWTFRLVDANGNPVSSAGMATLYDKSLDALYPHNWSSSMRNSTFRNISTIDINSRLSRIQSRSDRLTYATPVVWRFPDLSPILSVPDRMFFSYGSILTFNEMPSPVMKRSAQNYEANDMIAEQEVKEEMAMDGEGESAVEETELRENLSELVFFNGDIETDENGEFELEFTMNDALTEWKMILLTHDKQLFTATVTESVKTQKDLMIQEQFPRFFREKDEMTLKATIIRTDKVEGSGTASLELKNAITGEDVSHLFDMDMEKTFEIGKSGQTVVEWKMTVPGVDKVPAVEFILSANMGDKSDAVKSDLPLVTNRKFITEAIPLFTPAESTRVFKFQDYDAKAASGSIDNFGFQLEYVPNPVWEAIKAMPAALSEEKTVTALMENYMIRELALRIVDENPQIKAVFNQWQKEGDVELNLSRKSELKIDDLSETPWVQAAQSQTDRMRRIAHLFDLSMLTQEQNTSLNRLARGQRGDGGWPWIEGGNYSSWYVTMMVLDYFADLQAIRNKPFAKAEQKVIDKAIKYIDTQFMVYWEKYLKGQLNEDELISSTVIHYVRIRMLYDNKLSVENADVLKKVVEKLEETWMKYPVPSEVYIGMALRNYDENIDISDLLKAVDQQLVKHEEMGAYYKGSFYLEFYAQSVPLTVAMMELYEPEEDYYGLIDQLKIFLLSNKRTTDWGQSSASMKAIYGLLYYGDPIVLDDGADVEITWNNELVKATKAEAGMGAISKSVTAEESAGGNYSSVTIDNKSNHISWGGLFWQYFEDMDKVQADGISDEFPLSIEKNFYREVKGDKGPVLKAIKDGDVLQVGDEITVQVNIRVDREMDFVHVKDDRPAGTEPMDAISGHKFQYGLYYYQATRDLSSDFYFYSISPGQYNLEYKIIATHEGSFSAGLAQAQSYYAPEMSSHSEGRKLEIGG